MAKSQMECRQSPAFGHFAPTALVVFWRVADTSIECLRTPGMIACEGDAGEVRDNPRAARGARGVVRLLAKLAITLAVSSPLLAQLVFIHAGAPQVAAIDPISPTTFAVNAMVHLQDGVVADIRRGRHRGQSAQERQAKNIYQ